MMRIHRELFIEELESRTAPSGFNVGYFDAPILTFLDGNNRTVDVYFYGSGIADGAGYEIEIFDQAGGAIGNGDFIGTIRINSGDAATGVLEVRTNWDDGTYRSLSTTPVGTITGGSATVAMNTIEVAGAINTVQLANVKQVLKTWNSGSHIQTINLTGTSACEAEIQVAVVNGNATGAITTFTASGQFGSADGMNGVIRAASVGTITVGGDFTGQMVTSALGNLTVNGTGGFKGSTWVTGSVSGNINIQQGGISGLISMSGNLVGNLLVPHGGISGTVGITGDSLGLIDIFGNLSGTIRANRFHNIDIGDHATETGSITPTGVINSTTTIDSLIIHGVKAGTVTAPGGITVYEVHGVSGRVLDPANSKFQFYDADGDLITVVYKGAGRAVVSDVNYEQPDHTDIATIRITGADATSTLTITNTKRGPQMTVTGGAVTIAGSGFGTLKIANSAGTVFNTAVNVVAGGIGTFYVLGNSTNVDLHTAGAAAKVQLNGTATNCDVDVDTSLALAQVSGTVTGCTFDVGTTVVNWKMMGDFLQSSLLVGGSATYLFVGGNVTNDQAVIPFDVGGVLSKFFVRGAVDNTPASPVTFLRAGGDVLSLSCSGPVVNSLGGGVASFDIAGSLVSGQFAKSISNTAIEVGGNVTTSLRLAAGMVNSTLLVNGWAKTVSVSAPLGVAAMDATSTVTLGSVASAFTASGLVLGNVTVNNGIAAKGKMSFSQNVSGTVTVNGVMDATSKISFSKDLAGTLNIGGNLSNTVVISGSVTGAGSRINIGQSLSGKLDVVRSAATAGVTVTNNLSGSLLAGVFGDVTVGGVFSGIIGDRGTTAGVGNTLTVGSTSGGVVTPANAFATYIGYP